ncbi:MAG: redoxin domain-containing protein [Planctomycetes bacterium]|nr:redoxin domain-containing protein [Planctomycetota bacterium]
MRAVLSFLFVLAISIQPSPAGLDEKTLRENPQWMPAQTSVTKTVEFQSGLKITPQDRLEIGGFEPEGVVLRKGTNEFLLPVAQTKLLADADAYRSKYTPEQQKLTARELLARQELWPYFVKPKEALRFSDRTAFEAGKSYPLWSVEKDGLHVYFERKGQTYSLEPAATDFFESALAAVVRPPSRLFDEVRANAIRADSGKPADLADEAGPKYLAIYHAAAWCPYCEQCTPDVTKWYDELRASGDKSIELVLLSADKSPAEFQKHLKDKQMKCLAVPIERNNHTFVLSKLFPNRPTPWLYVVDRQGKTIVDGDVEGQPKERTLAVLAKIDEFRKREAEQAQKEPGAK